jgi:hypothetical protein
MNGIRAVFCAVAYNAKKLSALQATTQKNVIMGNNAEKLPQCRTL